MPNQGPDSLMDNRLEEMIKVAIQGKGDHLHAIVRDEDVYLSGEVSLAETKREITNLVQKIPNVRMVINHIRLKLPEERRRIEHF